MEACERGGSLIAGLPDDLALQCLARVPRVHHSSVMRVCKSWRELFRSSALFKLRASLTVKDPWLVVVDARINSKSCFVYDLVSKRRSKLPPLVIGQGEVEHLFSSGMECVALGCQFFVLGGLDAKLNSGKHSVSIFDTITGKWSRGTDMNHARCYFACGVIGGKLYVSGGSFSNRTGEVYDPETRKWTMFASMPFSMGSIESFAVYKERLFITGVVQGPIREYRRLVSYHPATDTWEILSRMCRGWPEGHLAATDDDLLLVSRSNYVGKFDEKAGAWIRVGHVSSYYFPFECPRKSDICFGREVFYLNNLAGESMGLQKCDVVHQVLTRLFWGWYGAIIAV